MLKKLPFLYALVLLALVATGCEDPSNVGIGLVGETGGEPESVIIPASTFEQVDRRDLTGNTERYLAGRVDDPVLGTIETASFVDFGAGTGVTTEFRNGPVTAAELRLTPDYVYGDTLSTVTLRLLDMPEEWSGTDAPADTTLPAGAEILTFTFTANDTLVVVPLPADWVARNDTTLRSATFTTSFHGFKLEPVSGNAVVGFDRGQTDFRVTVQEDVDYPVNKNITTIRRTSPGNVPESRTVLADGLGLRVALDFDFDVEALEAAAVNRAVFVVYEDTSTFETNAPAHFFRPEINTIDVFGITETGESVFRARAAQGDDGRYSLTSSELVRDIQLFLRDESVYVGFQLGLLSTQNTIDALLVMAADVPGDARDTTPRAVLTITPFEN